MVSRVYPYFPASQNYFECLAGGVNQANLLPPHPPPPGGGGESGPSRSTLIVYSLLYELGVRLYHTHSVSEIALKIVGDSAPFVHNLIL
jgi:hypothetical protein